jgi:hypothetical protein
MTNEQSVLRKERRTPAEIQQIVSEFESSGLNRSQFCRCQGLTFGVLNRYLRRLAAAYGGGATSDGRVAVELAGKKLAAERTDGCDFQAAI